MTIRIKNKKVSKLRRITSTGKNRVDIEDPYFVGNRKSWSWHCSVCGSNMYPYKQDKYGDLVVACENPSCIKSGNFDHSINSELARLLKQLQSNSRKFYINYAGSYY